MIEQLFGSKTRVKLLHLFYSNPNRSFYVREITRKIDEQINSVRRELANLLSIGIIASDTTNNRLYYEVNQKYEHYQALSSIFGGKSVKLPAKTTEVEDNLENQIKALGNVELALLCGQFTRDDSAGVDCLIVGDVNRTKIEKFIKDWEEKEGKDIRYAVLDHKDFDYRLSVKDKFVSAITYSKKQVIIDKNHIFEDK